MEHEEDPATSEGGSGEAPQPPDPLPHITDGTPDSDTRTLAMAAHLSGLAGFVGPLVIWLIKRDDDPFVEQEAREALNFQITIMIAAVGLSVMSMVICFVGPIIAMPLMLALLVFDLVFTIQGAVSGNEGKPFRYPFSWRILPAPDRR